MKLSTDELVALSERAMNLSHFWVPSEHERIKVGAAIELARLWLIEHGAKS